MKRQRKGGAEEWISCGNIQCSPWSSSREKTEGEVSREKPVSLVDEACNTSFPRLEDRLDLRISITAFLLISFPKEIRHQDVDFPSPPPVLYHSVPEQDPLFAMANSLINHHNLVRFFLPTEDQFGIRCLHLSDIIWINVFFRTFHAYDERC